MGLGPLLLPALAVAALTGYGLVWGVFWVLLGLTVLALVVLLAVSMFGAVSTMVRWIEFRPGGTANRIVIARFLRSTTMAAADLQRVVVVERIRLGRRRSIKVLLHTSAGTVACGPALSSPLSRVATDTLTDWLTEQLAPAGVAVELRTDVDRDYLCPDEWLTRSDLAALWHVPVGAVDELAAQHGVTDYRYAPQAGAISSPAEVAVYDPARAHDVAEELRAQRAADPEADGDHHPIGFED